MKQIIIVKPGTISDEDRFRFKEVGLIVIEHPNPDEVRVITETSALKGDDVLQAALSAINKGGSMVQEYFAKEFNKRFIK